MKTKKLKDVGQALKLAASEGEVLVEDENGERYTITHKPARKPIDIDEIRKLRVPMPGITKEELIESVHEMRAAGYH